MIMQRQSDGTYAQVGFIKSPTEDIEKIVDRNGDIYFTKGFTRQVTGYPVTLPDSIGKPLLDYKIYGNIFQETGTVTENKKLKDSNNNVIIDSEGNEIRTSEVVTNESPSPEHPAEVLGVGNKTDNGYEIPVVSRGKNLLSYPYYAADGTYNGVQITTDSLYRISIDGITNGGVNFLLVHNYLLKAGTYTISLSSPVLGMTVFVYDIDNKTVITNLANDSKTFTISNNTAVNIYFNIGRMGVKCFGENIGVQLELGDTTTEYEPYRNQITTPIYLPEPLYKDDYVAKDKSGGKVHRAWGVKVFDGTENFTAHSTLKGWFQSADTTVLPNSFSYCTHFSYINRANPMSEGQFTTANSKNNGRYVFKMPDDTTLNDFKSFLSSEYVKGTPVTVYYPLAEPTEESIDLPDIPTLDGTTIIETDTEIPSSNIEVSYKSKKLQ